MTATLQRMVRDPRTGEVRLPHEPLSIIRTTENLGRTLIKINWETGGESVLFSDDIDSHDVGEPLAQTIPQFKVIDPAEDI